MPDYSILYPFYMEQQLKGLPIVTALYCLLNVYCGLESEHLELTDNCQVCGQNC